LCSVAKQIANSFTEIFGLLITFFFAVVVVVVVVGLCGCSSCSLQQRLNSNKSLLHYSRWCVVICEGGGDSSRRGSEFVDFKRIFVVGGGVREEEEEEEDQRRQQRTTTVSSSKLQQLWRKFQ
jgi:coenzyme F420-reducing hydrogenase gamma subunit